MTACCTDAPVVKCKVEGTVFSYEIENATNATLNSNINLTDILGPPLSINNYPIELDEKGNAIGSINFGELYIDPLVGYHFSVSASNDCGTSICTKNCGFSFFGVIRQNTDESCSDSITDWSITGQRYAVRNDYFRLEWFVVIPGYNDDQLLEAMDKILINGINYDGAEIRTVFMDNDTFDLANPSEVKGIYNFVDINRSNLVDTYSLTFSGMNDCGLKSNSTGAQFNVKCLDKYKTARYQINFAQNELNWTSIYLQKLNDQNNYALQFYNTIQPTSYKYYSIKGLTSFNIDVSLDLLCFIQGKCVSGSGATCNQYQDNLIEVPWSPYYSNHGEAFNLCQSSPTSRTICTKYDLGSIKLTKLYPCDGNLSSGTIEIVAFNTKFDYTDSYGFNPNGTYYKTRYDILAMPIIYIDTDLNLLFNLEPKSIKTITETGKVSPSQIVNTGSQIKTCDPCGKSNPNQCFSLIPYDYFYGGLMPQYNKTNTNPATWVYNEWSIPQLPCGLRTSKIKYWIPGTQVTANGIISNIPITSLEVGEIIQTYER